MLPLPSTSDLVPEKCQICSQPSHGNHFGAFTCRACAAFFRRSVVGSPIAYKCRLAEGKCETKENGKFNCKKCRLDRCVKAGMTPEKLQLDRDPISSNHRIMVAKKQILLSSIIPQSVQKFLGRPLFILACEPDLATSERAFIDVTFLIDHVSDLFANPEFQHLEMLSSMSMLDKLSYGLQTTRIPEGDQLKVCRLIGKSEYLLFWEHEFMTVAKWLRYCDEFQQLPKSMKLQFLKSIWFSWIRLERVITAAEAVKNKRNIYAMTRHISVDFRDFGFDISWFTKYKKEQLSYFFDAIECLIIPHIVEPIINLDPTIQEITYMLCLISFRHGGKQFGGDIQKLGDRLIENLANDLHNYYLNDLKLINYAGRLAKMMRIVHLVEKDMYERQERLEIAKLFDIFAVDFSHPEMFMNYKR